MTSLHVLLTLWVVRAAHINTPVREGEAVSVRDGVVVVVAVGVFVNDGDTVRVLVVLPVGESVLSTTTTVGVSVAVQHQETGRIQKQ